MTPILTAQTPSNIDKMEIEQAIIELLDDPPIEALVAIRYFVECLHDKANGRMVEGANGAPKRSSVIDQASYAYPTIGVPPAQLLGLTTVLSEGYDGDALADTEALPEFAAHAAFPRLPALTKTLTRFHGSVVYPRPLM